MDDCDFPPDDEDELKETFKRATDFVTYNAFVMNQDDLLYLYGRYKQALVGPCNEPMPGIFNFRNRSKWSSWNSLGNMAKEEAMQQYIDKINDLKPDWDASKPKEKDVSEKKHFGPVNSTCLNTDPELAEESKTVFDYVKEGNLEKVKHLLNANGSIKSVVDDDGLSLLHWACDRGYSEIVSLLLTNGTDVNSQDKDGQTPLHYASSCGHENVVNLLLEAGANINIFDSDGLKPADVAYSTELKKLLI